MATEIIDIDSWLESKSEELQEELGREATAEELKLFLDYGVIDNG
tara:strand:+ start:14475 stop:14609 length:135 start_codon:yes stop_codon:yes gene_type:complete